MADPKRSRSPKTELTYENAFRTLIRIIGTETLITHIDRRECRRVQDVLMKLPPNASKRFPGISINETIAEAKKRNVPHSGSQNRQ